MASCSPSTASFVSSIKYWATDLRSWEKSGLTVLVFLEITSLMSLIQGTIMRSVCLGLEMCLQRYSFSRNCPRFSAKE